MTGEAVAEPGNFFVRVGTSYAELLAECGGVKEGKDAVKALAGGPMMGIAMGSLDVPIQKQNNGLTLMTEDRLEKGGIAVIEIGGNDSDLDWKAVCESPEKSADSLVRVTLPDFRTALSAMVEKARRFGLIPVLSTPIPVIADRYFDWISKPLDRERILDYLGAAEYIYRWQERYDIAVRGIAAKLNVALFDIRTRFLQERRIGDIMSQDGIHPNEKGHAIIRDTALEKLSAFV